MADMIQVFLGSAVLCSVAMAELQDAKFLLMSSTRLSKVMYVALPHGGPDSLSEPLKPQPLIETGLKSPGGICWHPGSHSLYVADVGGSAVYKYRLGFSATSVHIVGSQEAVAKDVPAKWVGCDVLGNLYFSDETGKTIQKIDTQNVMRGKTTAKPIILYSAATVSAMGAPNGIVVDNFRMYWVDDVGGSGAVMTGLLTPPDTDAAATARTFALKDNTIDGVCITPNNLIFTGTDESVDPPKGIVYGMRKAGDDGVEVVISDKLKGPAGCTWDGDGTVYVADAAGNAVMAIPSNMGVITPYKITKTVDFEDATSLVVVSGTVPIGLATALSSIIFMLTVQA